MTPIATFIRPALASRGWTIRELARRLGFETNSFVSGILLGTKSLPSDATEKWAAALQLNAFERERWMQVCARELAPDIVLHELDRLRDENASQARRIKDLEAAIVTQATTTARARRR